MSTTAPASVADPMVVPPGLDGVVVADTAIGDVRGAQGFFHYRQYSAVDLARRRTLEDVWALLIDGTLLPAVRRAGFAAQLDPTLPPRVVEALVDIAPVLRDATPLEALRTALGLAVGDLGVRPTLDADPAELRASGLRLCAMVPTLVATLHHLAAGRAVPEPDPQLGYAAGYLRMLTGEEPPAGHVAALERYLILTMDHGFNASTFTARVVASTGADLGSALVAALGALSGPLHGGAPSRALDMLDAIDDPAEAEAHVRDLLGRGQRIMGFGHRVYRGDDPRSALLREVALGLGGPLVDKAVAVERTVLDVLAELRPGRQLCTNVEFYAGVVMATCGIPRELFTSTFAASRMIGWTAHVMEQARSNRIIRPSSRYVGPTAPEPVPAA